MAKRNSQLTELLVVAQDDYLTIVDTSAGQSKRVSVKNLTGLPDTGWTATGESWSFSSFNSATRIGVITVPSDATTKYSVGMKARFAQSTGGTKYGFIVAVTTTTLSVFFSQGITFNNEAITSPVYSVQFMPFGYTGPVLTKEGYQSDVTNTERWVHSISGWGGITFSGAGAITSENVAYGMTFAVIPLVQITQGGDQVSGAHALGSGGSFVHGLTTTKAVSLLTTGFTAFCGQSQGSNYSTGNVVYYHWQAKGPVA